LGAYFLNIEKASRKFLVKRRQNHKVETRKPKKLKKMFRGIKTPTKTLFGACEGTISERAFFRKRKTFREKFFQSTLRIFCVFFSKKKAPLKIAVLSQWRGYLFGKNEHSTNNLFFLKKHCEL